MYTLFPSLTARPLSSTQRQWQVHRVLRPEAYGGLVHNTLMNNVKTPLPDSILRNTVGIRECTPSFSIDGLVDPHLHGLAVTETVRRLTPCDSRKT